MKTKTMTTITYAIGNNIITVLHFEGEIKKSQLPAVLRDKFSFTNHLGESESVISTQQFTIGEDVIVTVDVDDVNVEDCIIINSISDILKNHEKMYMLEGFKLTAVPKKVAVIKRRRA